MRRSWILPFAADGINTWLAKTFRNIAAAEDVLRHHLTERGVLFSRKELDERLMSRERPPLEAAFGN